MAGTVIITGANGSLAIHAFEHILSLWPDRLVILAVRDASDADQNTKRLRDIISAHPNAKASIRALDLSTLSAVHEFATSIRQQVASGDIPPVESIICNAFYWNLNGPSVRTQDDYDMTFQVNHIAQAALVLQLLTSFGPTGRVVLFTSDAQFPGKNPLEKIPPAIPEDLEDLVKADESGDFGAFGFQRYANSKLVVTTWTHILNQHLQKVGSVL
ncbi:hypothetical protein BX600DRAFT_451749 [Xylariales sp. PMI_506]|nr:hypothetical protein BX600DRAFT_451749 [Xylariales sp. PMI_506]